MSQIPSIILSHDAQEINISKVAVNKHNDVDENRAIIITPA